jgi:hypothetical protein
LPFIRSRKAKAVPSIDEKEQSRAYRRQPYYIVTSVQHRFKLYLQT